MQKGNDKQPEELDINLATLKNYIKTYYSKEIELNSDFDFQEDTRIKTAVQFMDDEKLSHLGWTSMNIINDSYKKDKEKLSEKFDLVLKTNIEECKKIDKTQNVRQQVKKMWMFPRNINEFIPWKQFAVTKEITSILETANKITNNLNPTIKIVHGKIYVVLSTFITTLSATHNNLNIIGDLTNLIPNIETEHIILVNSDIVAKLDESKLNKLLEEWKNVPINLKFTSLSHTVSLDWAIFSVCVVLNVSSDPLNVFISQFNKLFNTNIKITKHITIAILPRQTIKNKQL